MKGLSTATEKTTVICIAIIIIIGLVPLTWYHSSYTIIRGDNSPYWFNSPKTFSNDMSLWLSNDGTGHLSRTPYLAALFGIMFTLQSLGLTNSIIQVILNCTLLICSGLCMYFLLSVLTGKKPIALLFGSMFYMFAMIFTVNAFSLVISWAHAFLPLVLGLFVILIKKRVNGESSGKFLLAFLASFSFFMSFLADNPPVLIVGLLSLLVVFLYMALKHGLIGVTWQSLKVGALTIIVSLWWIIPLALISLQIISVPGQNLAPRIHFQDSRSSIFNILWFNPIWGWTPMYYPYTDYYANPIVILSTFVPILIAACGLLFKHENKGMQYFFLGIVLLLVPIEAGSHVPFEPLKIFLNGHIPMFDALFREPQNKFGLIMALFTAPLLVISFDSLTNGLGKISFRLPGKLKRVMPVTIIAIVFSTIIISAGPMFAGLVAQQESENIPFPSYVRVPEYWNEAGEFFTNDPSDFRVLITPDSPFTYLPYTWGYWGSDYIPMKYIQKAVLYNTYDYDQRLCGKVMNMTYEAIENDSTLTLNNTLSALNAKYVLLRNDLVWNFSTPPAIPPAVVKQHLDNSSLLQYNRTIGALDIYEYKYWTPTHLLMSPIPFEDNATSLLNEFSPATAVTYTRISSTEYVVHINATQPFYLFFSESFDTKWKLTEVNQNGYLAPFSRDLSENHSIACGFANTWYIAKTGSYDLKVYYTPESYFSYGVIISVLSFSLISAYIGIVSYVKSRKKR